MKINRRNIVVSECITLDGIAEDPEGLEGYEYGGWILPYIDPEYTGFIKEEIMNSSALLLGRTTYLALEASTPFQKTDPVLDALINDMPKYVVSASLSEISSDRTILIKDNLMRELSLLKQQPGPDILLAGSISLVRVLSAHNLIDEYRFLVHPVILGKGRKLFAETAVKFKLKLIQVSTFRSGVSLLRYRPLCPFEK